LQELATGWQGIPATNASRFLKDHISGADTHMTTRIKATGLCLLGKTNAPENGWFIATEPALYGPTLNPWDKALTPGGSSGGSSVAIATGMVPIAGSSDAAGSIRVPASCCGVVGLKPSPGRVSLSPLADYFAGAAYFSCNTGTVRDTAAFLDVIAGSLPGDPYALPDQQASFATSMTDAPAGLQIGFTVTDPAGNPVHPDVRDLALATAMALMGLGHHVREHDMRFDLDQLWQTYTDMTCIESAAFFGYMETVVGRPIGPGDVEPLTLALIARGRATSGITQAGQIETVRQIGRSVVQDLLAFDVFLTPTLTQLPRPKGHYDMTMSDLDAYDASWADADFMGPFNLSGQPAISMVGMSRQVPLGVQLVGRSAADGALLAVVAVLEQVIPWKHRHPPTGI
ncbi:MAG: amidase, partial [Candidatus Saccharibacteria bacterium]|nr:amidase [Pseudorhodobacter sp.]